MKLEKMRGLPARKHLNKLIPVIQWSNCNLNFGGRMTHDQGGRQPDTVSHTTFNDVIRYVLYQWQFFPGTWNMRGWKKLSIGGASRKHGLLNGSYCLSRVGEEVVISWRGNFQNNKVGISKLIQTRLSSSADHVVVKVVVKLMANRSHLLPVLLPITTI